MCAPALCTSNACLIISWEYFAGILDVFPALQMRNLKLEKLRETKLVGNRAQFPTKIR